MENRLSENEDRFLHHMNRFGSDAYPMAKVRGGWLWSELFGIKGAPVVYKTKKACEAAIEAYIDVLLDRKAGRIEGEGKAACVVEDGVFTIKLGAPRKFA